MRSFDLAIVHDVGMPSLKEDESLTDCASPLCDVRFQQTGLAMKPRRFCSDECKQHASIIRRAMSLLATLGEERACEVFVEMFPRE